VLDKAPDKDVYELTQAAYDRLRAEYDDLVTNKKIDIARKIEAARELGDLSENGDYHAAKEEQGKMAGRIAHLNAILENHVIIETGGSTEVRTGSIVTIRYEGDDDTERYLLGSIEERSDDLDVISPGSALGEALMDKKAGDTVSYETPTGATLSVEVVGVE
jgi:transcription elongation factor GreA